MTRTVTIKTQTMLKIGRMERGFGGSSSGEAYSAGDWQVREKRRCL